MAVNGASTLADPHTALASMLARLSPGSHCEPASPAPGVLPRTG